MRTPTRLRAGWLAVLAAGASAALVAHVQHVRAEEAGVSYSGKGTLMPPTGEMGGSPTGSKTGAVSSGPFGGSLPERIGDRAGGRLNLSSPGASDPGVGVGGQ